MNTVKLIVYGTLMSGERNHRFCRNAVSITPCTVTGTLYDSGYGFPAFVPEGDGVVNAELIEIPIEDWAALCGTSGSSGGLDAFRRVSAGVCRRESGGLVVAWVA